MDKQLTAEQVREAILDGMQTIADELNLALDDEQNETTNDATGTKSRWHQFFGTPERAARTLHTNGTLACRECLLHDECLKTPEDSECMILAQDALLEWLRGEA